MTIDPAQGLIFSLSTADAQQPFSPQTTPSNVCATTALPQLGIVEVRFDSGDLLIYLSEALVETGECLS